MQAHVNGHSVFYTLEGHGRPLLLMHGGLGLDHTYFRPWLDPLGEDVQLIFYDLYGNGRSERPASYDGVDIGTWIEEADALRAHLGHEKIILFGHSFGSFFAQEYALRYGNHLTGLILCDSAPALDYPDLIVANAQARGTPEQVQALLGALGNPASVEKDADFQHVWKTILPFYFHHYDPAIAAAMDAATHYSGGAYRHSFTAVVPAFNTLERLNQITVPTLILGGQDDWITPPAQGAARLQAGIPHARQAIFEHSGHFPFIEEQAAFLATVKAWLSTLR